MAFTPSEFDLLAVGPATLAVKVFLSPAPLLEADRESDAPTFRPRGID